MPTPRSRSWCVPLVVRTNTSRRVERVLTLCTRQPDWAKGLSRRAAALLAMRPPAGPAAGWVEALRSAVGSLERAAALEPANKQVAARRGCGCGCECVPGDTRGGLSPVGARQTAALLKKARAELQQLAPAAAPAAPQPASAPRAHGRWEPYEGREVMKCRSQSTRAFKNTAIIVCIFEHV